MTGWAVLYRVTRWGALRLPHGEHSARPSAAWATCLRHVLYNCVRMGTGQRSPSRTEHAAGTWAHVRRGHLMYTNAPCTYWARASCYDVNVLQGAMGYHARGTCRTAVAQRLPVAYLTDCIRCIISTATVGGLPGCYCTLFGTSPGVTALAQPHVWLMALGQAT